jgi:hypothetical protein
MREQGNMASQIARAFHLHCWQISDSYNIVVADHGLTGSHNMPALESDGQNAMKARADAQDIST